MTARRWLLLTLGWLLTATLLSAYVHLAYDVQATLLQTLGRQLASAALFLPLTGLALAIQERPRSGQASSAVRAAIFCGLCLGVGGGYSLGMWALQGRVGPSVFAFGFVVGALVLAMVRWLSDRRELARRERQAVELERDLGRARLAVVENQVQPHFLFNTLHAIGLTCEEEPRRARQMIELLAELLRDSLARADARGLVGLEDEMRRVERYVRLMSFRHDEELDVSFVVEPAAREVEVPAFAVQTLVENAMKHAVSSETAARWIEVRARRVEDGVSLSVSDDGPGFRDAAGPRDSGGDGGLANLRERMAFHFGDAGRLSLGSSVRGGARVTLLVPLRLPEKGA